MKTYTLKEIKKIWLEYKLPTLAEDREEFFDLEGVPLTGIWHNMKGVRNLYNVSEYLSFPEFLEYLEERERKKIVKQIKE